MPTSTLTSLEQEDDLPVTSSSSFDMVFVPPL